MSEFVFPAGCETCPVQAAFKESYDEAGEAFRMCTSVGEAMVGDAGQEFDSMIEDNFTEIAGENGVLSIQEKARKEVAEQITAYEKAQDGMIELSVTTAGLCSRVLKMRARRNAREYTVAICTSTVVDTDEGQDIQPSRIWVKEV